MDGYVIGMTTLYAFNHSKHTLKENIRFLEEAQYGQKLRVILNDKVGW